MGIRLEVTEENAIHASASFESPIIGTQYNVSRKGQEEVAVQVTVDNEGVGEASTVAPYKEEALSFVVSPEAATRVSEDDIALFVASAVLQPSAQTEAAVLVALGEDGFASI